jgi:Flp pilus assembly protein TadG
MAMTGGFRIKLLAVARRSWAGHSMRRMLRDRSGATAVEFAMVAAPFLALVFAILQTGMVFFAGQALETAAADSARLIMTGQAQTQGYDQTKFRQAVCARIYALLNCDGSLYIDVKSYTSWSSVNTSLPVDGSGNIQSGTFGYQPGGPTDIVIMRLMYQWPIYASLLGFNLSNSSGNQRLLMATVAFRNEPYM